MSSWDGGGNRDPDVDSGSLRPDFPVAGRTWGQVDELFKDPSQ